MRQRLQAAFNQVTKSLKAANCEILELKTIITGLEKEHTIRLDVERQLAMEVAENNRLKAQNGALQDELHASGEYISTLEAKYLKCSQTSIDILKHLKNAEFEIETLKQYIIDLKSRIAVYIPVKGDAVDKRLAEYINNFPDRQKLKIMFMRESDGVYQFGTKRVTVRVDKDKINIRVGGGYLSIDEFLDQYTPLELEKYERNDPLKRLNQRASVQMHAASMDPVRENSPIRKSPTKGRKLAI